MRRKIYVGVVLTSVLCAVAFVTFSGMLKTGDSSSDGRNVDCVAELGKRCISLREYSTSYRNELENIESMIRHKLSDDQIRMFGIKEMLLRNMVSDIVMQKFTSDLGLRIGTKSVKDLIRNVKAFQDSNGKFDRERYETLLGNAGMTEASYTSKILSAIPLSILLECIFPRNDEVNQKYYKSVLKDVLVGMLQNRVVDIVEVSADAVKASLDEKISEDKLQAMYDEERGSLNLPEYRSSSYIVVKEDDFIDTVEVSAHEVDVEIKNSELHDQRDVLNLVYTSKKEAEEAYSAFKDGKTFEDLVSAAGTTIESSTINNITKDVLPVDARSAVFSLNDGEVSEVFQSMVGWHIMKVLKRHPISDEDLVILKERIALNLKRQKAAEVLSGSIRRANEMISRGSTLDEIKAVFRNPSSGVLEHFDINGYNTSGGIVNFPIPSGNALVSLAFSSQLGKLSHLVNAGDIYLGVLVTDVLPSRPRTFEESREVLTEKWRNTLAMEKAGSLAVELAAKLKRGDELKDVVGVSVLRDQTVTKAGDYGEYNDQYPSSLVDAIFSMAPGDVSKEIFDSGKVYFAQLKEIKTPEITEKEIADNKDHMINSSISSLKDQLLNHLIDKYKVKIRSDLLENV